MDQNITKEQLNKDMLQAVLGVTIFVGIEACIGFLGNVLIICVFAFRYHHCNYRYFVLCLAVIDLTSCLITIPGEIVTQTNWYTYPSNGLCKAKSFFNIFTVAGSAFSLLFISLERYLKVCKPFGFQFKPKLALAMCCLGVLTSAVLAVPAAVFWGVQHTRTKKNNISVVKCLIDDHYKGVDERAGPERYAISVGALLGVTMLVITINYVRIARKIFQARQISRALRTNSFTSPHIHSGVQNESIWDTESSTNGGINGSIALQHARQYECEGPLSVRVPSGTATATDVCYDTTTSDVSIRAQFPRCRQQNTHDCLRQVVRKTLIMFILSMVFILTTILYFVCLTLIANGVLDKIKSYGGKAGYFFVFRLYFINHVINPFIYGFLDSSFRLMLRDIMIRVRNVLCCCSRQKPNQVK